jgi:hypothetical protein
VNCECKRFPDPAIWTVNAEPQVVTLARQEGEVAKVGTLAQQEEAAEMLVLRPEVS